MENGEERGGTVTPAREKNRCRSAHVRLVFFLFFLSALAFLRLDCLRSLFEWQSVKWQTIEDVTSTRMSVARLAIYCPPGFIHSDGFVSGKRLIVPSHQRDRDELSTASCCLRALEELTFNAGFGDECFRCAHFFFQT